jgi:hypothetical protein
MRNANMPEEIAPGVYRVDAARIPYVVSVLLIRCEEIMYKNVGKGPEESTEPEEAVSANGPTTTRSTSGRYRTYGSGRPRRNS